MKAFENGKATSDTGLFVVGLLHFNRVDNDGKLVVCVIAWDPFELSLQDLSSLFRLSFGHEPP